MGDWKRSDEGGNGYLMVTLNGMPYWANAVGNIPFAVNRYHDLLTKTGDPIKAIQGTVQTGIDFGGGLPGTADYTNTMDNYFILRGALWAFMNYRVKDWSPNNLGIPISPYFKNLYLNALQSTRSSKKATNKGQSGSKKGSAGSQKTEFHQNPRFL
jgi:hypothetical protein